MSYGLAKISMSIAKKYAMGDWLRVKEYALDSGFESLVSKYEPKTSYGYKRIDRCTLSLIEGMGHNPSFFSMDFSHLQ